MGYRTVVTSERDASPDVAGSVMVIVMEPTAYGALDTGRVVVDDVGGVEDVDVDVDAGEAKCCLRARPLSTTSTTTRAASTRCRRRTFTRRRRLGDDIARIVAARLSATPVITRSAGVRCDSDGRLSHRYAYVIFSFITVERAAHSVVVSVRQLSNNDIDAAVALHLDVLDMEFLSRFGVGFMRSYYRAWVSATGSIGLVALDHQGAVLGVVLGATDPAAHVRAMVRHDGLRLATKLLGHSLVHPQLAKDLVVTRGWRYSRALVRLVTKQLSKKGPVDVVEPGPVLGEITHVLVRPSAQGQGVGRALIDESVKLSRAAGVQELALVTPPDMAAKHFYERLGWRADGAMQSRSGEAFLRYRYTL